jgi:hypothetical protein
MTLYAALKRRSSTVLFHVLFHSLCRTPVVAASQRGQAALDKQKVERQ